MCILAILACDVADDPLPFGFRNGSHNIRAVDVMENGILAPEDLWTRHACTIHFYVRALCHIISTTQWHENVAEGVRL